MAPTLTPALAGQDALTGFVGLNLAAVAVLALPIVGLCIGLAAYWYREKKRRVRRLPLHGLPY